MVMLKPAWLVERQLPSQLQQVGTKSLTLPSSKDLIGLLDKVGSLMSHMFSKSIQDALVPIKGSLISKVLANQTDFDVQISLASCLF